MEHTILSNRTLYLFVVELTKAKASNPITLVDYLRRLKTHSERFSAQDHLTHLAFRELLRSGFEEKTKPSAPKSKTAAFYEWSNFIDRQIADLTELENDGRLNDPHRYFGIDTRAGVRWYNFDPGTFLECATCGTFEGWQPGDESNRTPVDDAISIKTNEEPLPIITWPMFTEFLWCGQHYE